MACALCLKTKEEVDLLNMKGLDLFVGEEILDFNELLENLFSVNLHPELTALICQECTNLLTQFHLFKRKARECVFFVDANDNLSKVKLFLEENENEEVFCLRYNKCLTLVPNSKRSFIENFKNWQPQVALEKLVLKEPPLKKRKLANQKEEPQLEFEGALEIEVISDVQDSKEEQAEEAYTIVEESLQDEMTEEEWLKTEMLNSELIETEDGGEMESWVCSHCVPSERYLDQNEFRQHLLSIHLNCEQIVYDEGEASEDCEASLQDDISQVDNSLSISLNESQKEVALSDLYHCLSCSFTTFERSDFKLHEKTHFDKRLFNTSRFEKLFCIDCSYQFTSAAHFNAHINGHQLFEIVAKHAQFPICGSCNFMFCDEVSLDIHEEHHDFNKEAIPAEGFFLKFGHHRPDQTEEPETLDERALKCGHCLKKFHDEESCRLHQFIFHITILKCPFEFRVFNGNQAFSIHMKNNHPELFGFAKFQCSVCKVEFDTLYEKLKHMKTCDKKKFQCSHCDKKFSQKCYLMTHLRQISGQTSVVCDICQKVCRDKGDYQIHYRSHSNVKPFECSICPKAYKTSSARAAHLETHMEKGFECKHCNIKFKSRRTLQKHVKTKHQLTNKAIANEESVF